METVHEFSEGERIESLTVGYLPTFNRLDYAGGILCRTRLSQEQHKGSPYNKY